MPNTAIKISVPTLLPVPQIKKTVIDVTPNLSVVSKTIKTPSKMSKAEYRKMVNEEMYLHVLAMISMLISGELYTLKMICTDEFWNRHYASSHRGQGRYISKLVKDGVLPLVACGRNSSKSKLYRLK
jgi:hypothetical protein